MKKISFILLLTCTFILSCSDKESSSEIDTVETEIESLPGIGDKVLERLAYDRDFDVIKSNFTIWQNKENEIVILSNDDLPRNLFILQGAKKPTSLTDGNYEIVYLKHSILAHNLETGAKTYLRLDNKKENILTEKVKAQNILIDDEIVGYGLIYGFADTKNNKDFSVDILKKQESLIGYFAEIHENKGYGSGGPGASECSIVPQGGGGCSVTCNPGYYACCNIDCYCVPEG